MNIVKKILIPFNFSKTSLNALEYAINFANNEKNIALHMVYIITKSTVLEKQRIEQGLKDIVNEAKNRTESPILYEIEQGELVPTIIDYQNKIGMNMIIMGTRGSDHLENTNTTALIKGVDCSVVVVPTTYNAKFKLNTIAVALDKDKIDDKSVLNILLDTTRRFNAQVHALTISNDVSSYSEADESNENLLNYYLEHFYSHHVFPKGDNIEKSVFEYVKKHKIDLLCILSRHHSPESKPSEGKLVSALAKHTPLPLLILD